MEEVEAIKNLTEVLKKVSRKRRKEILVKLIEILRREGKSFSPRNFIWKLLTEDIFQDVVIRKEEHSVKISPALINSLLKHGQILPVFLTPDGKIIDGKARVAVLGDKVEFLILPDVFSEELIQQTRITACEDRDAKIAELLMEKLLSLRSKGHLNSGSVSSINSNSFDENKNYSEDKDLDFDSGSKKPEEKAIKSKSHVNNQMLIKKALASIEKDMNLLEKANVYILIKQLNFWNEIKTFAEGKIKSLEKTLTDLFPEDK